jgi:hypothetical protein
MAARTLKMRFPCAAVFFAKSPPKQCSGGLFMGYGRVQGLDPDLILLEKRLL